MRLSSINNTNFGKVYALYGTRQQMKKVCHVLTRNSDENFAQIKIVDMTDTYKNYSSNGLLAKSAQAGKEVAFVVTGSKDCEQIDPARPQETAISTGQFISKFLDVNNANLGDIEEIKLSVLANK